MYIGILMQLEILFVNLFITHLIAKKKYSIRLTITSLLLFTIASSSLFLLLKPDNAPTYFSIFLGVSFILPLSLLFKESLLKMSTIMFYCWTETLIIYSFSQVLGNVLDSNIAFLPLIIQTVLLAISFPIMVIFAKVVYKVIIEGISKESFDILMVITIVLFSMALLFTYFIDGVSLTLISLLLLQITTLAVYILLRDFVVKSNKVIALNKIAFTDSLTQLNNRFSLFANTNLLIEDKIPFHCIYMDLDNLKDINDTYGHTVGDQYLRCFSNAVVKSIGEQSIAYRLGGDEFVIISRNDSVDRTALKARIEENFDFEIDFNGVSIGYSTYLKDGYTLDELLDASDTKMYKRKQKAKYRVSSRN